MGVIYAASLRETRMLDVATAINAGGGAAYLEVGDLGFVKTLATFTLSFPASVVAGDVLTALSMPKSATASDTGTASEARLKDSGGTVVVSGLTVGTVGTNVIISPSTSITLGQSCSLTALTITHNSTGA